LGHQPGSLDGVRVCGESREQDAPALRPPCAPARTEPCMQVCLYVGEAFCAGTPSSTFKSTRFSRWLSPRSNRGLSLVLQYSKSCMFLPPSSFILQSFNTTIPNTQSGCCSRRQPARLSHTTRECAAPATSGAHPRSTRCGCTAPPRRAPAATPCSHRGRPAAGRRAGRVTSVLTCM